LLICYNNVTTGDQLLSTATEINMTNPTCVYAFPSDGKTHTFASAYYCVYAFPSDGKTHGIAHIIIDGHIDTPTTDTCTDEHTCITTFFSETIPQRQQQRVFKSQKRHNLNRLNRRKHSIHQPGRTNCSQRFHQ